MMASPPLEPGPELDVRFFVPPDDLEACFSIFYRIEVTPAKGRTIEDYLLPEWANIRFSSYTLPSAIMQDGREVSGRFVATGPSSCAIRFRLQRTRIWGIGFLPLGWARFIDLPASEHANTVQQGESSSAFARFAPLVRILCRPENDDEAQYQRAVEFFRNLAGPPRDEARIRAILKAMYDPHLAHVGELAERVGLTNRTLERTCLRHFGFPPQTLLRRQRAMRSLASFMLSEHTSWRQTFDQHYHDQAHFVREFKAFMGMGPSEYARLPHPILRAFMAERNRVWGPGVPSFEPLNARLGQTTPFGPAAN